MEIILIMTIDVSAERIIVNVLDKDGEKKNVILMKNEIDEIIVKSEELIHDFFSFESP